MCEFASAIGYILAIVVCIGYFGRQFIPAQKPGILGIDLGTTYSCIGYYESASAKKNGTVRLIKVQANKFCIPSVVSINSSHVLVGFDALHSQMPIENILFDSKRFLGRIFTEENVNNEQLNYKFHLSFNNSTGEVDFTLFNGSTISPLRVSSLIVDTLINASIKHLGYRVKSVVIAVPADFDDRQRIYTTEAVNSLNLQVQRLINEPTAAALAYGLENISKDKSKYAIYIVVVDVGGGTTDCSLLRKENGLFITQAMSGIQRLGGQDFNNNLIKHWRSMNISDEDENLNELAEQCKVALSTNFSWHPDHVNTHFWMSRSKFEEVNEQNFKMILDPIKYVLHYANLSGKDIHKVVLVGGSTRIPRIKSLVIDLFSEQQLCDSIDPDITVIRGVCMQAGIISNGWPLTVSAIEIKNNVRKVDI
ncbi:hypothetical protein GJ496_000380 [Pomphorhynchus laevis]|nr:hypothetical protein GJ496_000380 [Pomphorhynchus laevis]